MKNWQILFVAIFLCPIANAERVRKVEMKRDQIVQVKTALGVATIIQVADNPTSLVVGDNEAFKVEFLEQAITIKPLHPNAKSNLYIYTEYRRFDVQLVTVPEPNADYVVYLDTAIPAVKFKPLVRWKPVALAFENEDLNFHVKRLGQSDLSLFVEFEVSSKKKASIDPSCIWISQGNITVPIHRLVLSSFKADSADSIHGMVELLKDDLNLSKQVAFEVRRKTSTRIEISRPLLW